MPRHMASQGQGAGVVHPGHDFGQPFDPRALPHHPARFRTKDSESNDRERVRHACATTVPVPASGADGFPGLPRCASGDVSTRPEVIPSLSSPNNPATCRKNRPGAESASGRPRKSSGTMFQRSSAAVTCRVGPIRRHQRCCLPGICRRPDQGDCRSLGPWTGRLDQSHILGRTGQIGEFGLGQPFVSDRCRTKRKRNQPVSVWISCHRPIPKLHIAVRHTHGLHQAMKPELRMIFCHHLIVQRIPNCCRLVEIIARQDHHSCGNRATACISKAVVPRDPVGTGPR